MFVKRFFKTGATMVAIILATVTVTMAQIDITTAFTDDIFRAEVYEIIDKEEGERIYDTDVMGITDLNVSYMGIASLEGIQHFVNLIGLVCVSNRLTSLDVSRLTNLDYLLCDMNQLTSLNLSGLTNLTELRCGDNQLTSLDVSGLTNLTRLQCNSNRLTSLDVSGLADLYKLWCQNNELTSLKAHALGEPMMLSEVYCYNNKLTSLDLSELKNLARLECQNNQLTYLHISEKGGLNRLWCFENNLADESAVIGYTGGWGDMFSNFRFSPQNDVSSILHPTIQGTRNSIFNMSLSVMNGGLSILNYTLSTDAMLTFSMYDLKGKRMAHHPKRLQMAGRHDFTVKIPKGFYIIEARVFNGTKEVKFTEKIFVR